MSNALMAQTLGFVDEAIASEELITNNNSLMKIVRTMGTFSRQVSISSSIALTGGSIADVFTIVGGYIIVEGIIGRLTTACSANACTMAWGIDPTVGAADIPIGTAVEMNAATLGSFISAEGDGSALVIDANDTSPGSLCAVPFMAPAGGIDIDMQNSNLTTGVMDLVLIWRACSPAAYVTVA